jgi:hypothetical protein
VIVQTVNREIVVKNRVLLCTFSFILLLSSAPAWSGAALQGFTVVSSGPANGLFTSVGAQGAPNVQYVDAVWPVTIDLALLSTFPNSVVVNFPDRAWVTLTRMSSQQRGTDAFIWTGRGGDCSVFLREAPGSFKGQMACNNASYEVSAVPSGSGLQLVRAVAPTGTTQSDVVGPSLGASAGQVQAAQPTQVDTSIDILVLYTAAVRIAKDGPGGGNTQTKLLAQDSVDLLQTALNNSTPNFPIAPAIATVNLVAAQEVLHTATGNFFADLLYLQTDPEPMAMRNFWAADVVMYMSTSGGAGFSGLSNQPDYSPTVDPVDFAPYALSALQYNCSLMVIGAGPSCVDNLVFPHEFAHTIGANHDVPDSPWGTGPPYPTMLPKPVTVFAFGHYGNVMAKSGYRTVMSYMQQPAVCKSPCSHVPYFSNHDVTTPDGFTTGVAGQQENAKVIASYAPTVAQYRLSLGRIFYNGFEGVQ